MSKRATPTDLALIGRANAHKLWAHVADRAAHTAPARREFEARFEREVDPDGVLPPEERARRAAHARKAYFARLALASAKARRAHRENLAVAPRVSRQDLGGAA